MFKTLSFYITLAVFVTITIAITCIMSEFINGFQTSEDGIIEITMMSEEEFIMCPVTLTSDFISMSSIFFALYLPPASLAIFIKMASARMWSATSQTDIIFKHRGQYAY